MQAAHLSSWAEVFQLDSWADVRYLVHSSDQVCWQDSLASMACTSMDWQWDTVARGGAGTYDRISCPPGFSHFLDTCLALPSSLSATTYSAAAASCGAGSRLLQSGGLLFWEAVRLYLAESGWAGQVWAGQWEEVKQDPAHAQLDWAAELGGGWPAQP